MQIEWIDTFLDLLDTRSFNKSAERLNITQSTVSARINALESQIGKKLFVRSRAGTELTAAGIAFEAHARGLRHSWSEALRVTRATGNVDVSIRIGLQTDLATTHIGDWVAQFQTLFPRAEFYVELDYSNQMCNDLLAGNLDFAVLYTPKFMPDLHFETVGRVNLRMISTKISKLKDVTENDYIGAHYAPAFDRQHQQHLPYLSNTRLSCGQNSAVAGMIMTIGGTGYVLEETAITLVNQGIVTLVEDAPILYQDVFAAFHIRHRHSLTHQKLRDAVNNHFSPK
jgi:DNA-binding transcriptional LysR family regulator